MRLSALAHEWAIRPDFMREEDRFERRGGHALSPSVFTISLAYPTLIPRGLGATWNWLARGPGLNRGFHLAPRRRRNPRPARNAAGSRP